MTLAGKIESNNQLISKRVTSNRDAILTNIATSRDQLMDKVNSGQNEIVKHIDSGSEVIKGNMAKHSGIIIQSVTASGEEVKQHVTAESEVIGYKVAAMGESYEEGIATAQKDAKAAAVEVSSMKAAFGALEIRLNESFSQKLAVIEENQQNLNEGIKGLKLNVNEISTEMVNVKENQGKLKAEFVSENEAFRGEVIDALERLNRMVSQLNMSTQPKVAAETSQ